MEIFVWEFLPKLHFIGNCWKLAYITTNVSFFQVWVSAPAPHTLPEFKVVLPHTELKVWRLFGGSVCTVYSIVSKVCPLRSKTYLKIKIKTISIKFLINLINYIPIVMFKQKTIPNTHWYSLVTRSFTK